MKLILMDLLREEEAASATEYAILIVIVAGVIFATLQFFDLTNAYSSATAKVSNCVSPSASNC